MTKFMIKTGVFSPNMTKIWKRKIEESQTWPANEDQPRAKQRKITEYGTL